MYCSECGQNNKKEAKFCYKCGKQLLEKRNDVKVGSMDNKESNIEKNHKTSSPKKKSSLSIVLVIIFIFIALGAIGNYLDSIEQEEANKEATKIFDDAIRGTDTASNENKEYVDLISKVFEYYKSENEKIFATCLSLEQTDILEFSSYEPQSKLKSYITNIKMCLNELDNLSNKLTDMKSRAVNYTSDLLDNSNIPLKERKDALDGMIESMSDEKQEQLVIKRGNALIDHYKLILEVYELLDADYLDYELGIDEYGDDTIYFSTDYLLNTYNELAEKTEITSAAYLKAENDLMTYANKRMKSHGLNIDINEIVDYMYEN